MQKSHKNYECKTVWDCERWSTIYQRNSLLAILNKQLKFWSDVQLKRGSNFYGEPLHSVFMYHVNLLHHVGMGCSYLSAPSELHSLLSVWVPAFPRSCGHTVTRSWTAPERTAWPEEHEGNVCGSKHGANWTASMQPLLTITHSAAVPRSRAPPLHKTWGREWRWRRC